MIHRLGPFTAPVAPELGSTRNRDVPVYGDAIEPPRGSVWESIRACSCLTRSSLCSVLTTKVATLGKVVWNTTAPGPVR